MKQFFAFQTISSLVLILFTFSAFGNKTSKISSSFKTLQGGSEAEYSIENPTITGANQYVEFDINIASLLNNEDFYSGEIFISYNSLTFGTNIASSGRITLTKGTVITAPNYTLTFTDVSSDMIKIVAESTPNASNYYTLSTQSEQLIHFKIDITNLSGNTDIEFEELTMQGLSEFYDATLGSGQPFETIYADDELDIDINGIVCNCTLSNNTSNSWYYKGISKSIDYQQDVYVFRLNTYQSYTSQLNNSVVDKIEFHGATGLKYNVVYFNKNSSQTDRNSIINQIRNESEFDLEFPAVTEFSSDDYTQKKWMFSNDVINIVFHNPDPTQYTVQYIANKYNLSVEHEPSATLPKGINSWTYAFKINPVGCNCQNAIDIAREIYQNENTIIKIAEPWLEPSREATTTNDPYFSDSWHIDNTGQCLGMSSTGNNSGNGTTNADCNIEAAWNLGYTGNGIKVAVIDKGVYNNNHPDISSKYINGYDFIDNDNDVTTCSGTTGGHGQACAGLIAAIADNNEGVVGVAYDAQIIPIITWLGTAYKGFQHALNTANADIVSCSWGWEGGPSQAIENDIALCKSLGRGGKGIITVVSAGNENSNTTTFFPGYLDDVIGVIATNPDDTRKSFSDGWATWGSNYGPKHDIAAPGTHLISTDLVGGSGYNIVNNGCSGASNLNNNYTYFNGTSSAAPIVAGACAVVLSSNPNLTATQVQNTLQNTADKVGGYNYNAVSTGRSLEMGFGRVDFYDAVLTTNTTSIETNNAFKIYPNPSSSYSVIEFSLEQANDVSIIIRDYLGREVTTLISNQFIPANHSQTYHLNTSNLSNGLYFVTLRVGNTPQTLKLTVIQ
ncbi:MAG: S8 family serine peptidase [Saprospiraceae bacterium]